MLAAWNLNKEFVYSAFCIYWHLAVCPQGGGRECDNVKWPFWNIMAVGVEESLALRIREGANEAGHLTHRPKQVTWKRLKEKLLEG